MENKIKDTAIVGIGSTSFTRKATRSRLGLAVEAIANAIEDAGLKPDDVDGLTSHVFDPTTEREVLNCFGWRNLRFFAETAYGNSSATVGVAAMGVATGQARYTVAFRSISGRYGDGPRADRVQGEHAFYSPFGMRVPAHWVAVIAQRYLYEYKVDPRAFGWISVTCRKHGATNPGAVNYKRPITIEEHQASRMIADPLRLFDCTPNTEGACAVVVASRDDARNLRQPPVRILGFVQGTGAETENNTNYNRENILSTDESEYMRREMYEKTGIAATEVDVVQFYDHFTPLVLMGLEAWGFCGRGEGAAFVEGGERITIGGDVPLNTSGGHIGEAYVQSMNHIVDSVRQLRGTAPNQVAGAELSLVASGVNLPGSALMLGKD